MAEDAAEEHEAAKHPHRDRVVVVPVNEKLVAEEGADEGVETARAAQERPGCGRRAASSGRASSSCSFRVPLAGT